jgi:hypothetical protein
MARKATRKQEGSLEWLLERGEEALLELLGRRSVRGGVAKAAKRARATKGNVDKNVEAVLHLLNLPSRADYERLVAKVEHLQGSLVSLNMKLDRLLATQQELPRRRERPLKPQN